MIIKLTNYDNKCHKSNKLLNTYIRNDDSALLINSRSSSVPYAYLKNKPVINSDKFAAGLFPFAEKQVDDPILKHKKNIQVNTKTNTHNLINDLCQKLVDNERQYFTAAQVSKQFDIEISKVNDILDNSSKFIPFAMKVNNTVVYQRNTIRNRILNLSVIAKLHS